MPELPEVETIRKTLDQIVVGKKIDRVSVLLRRIIQLPVDPQLFGALLEGQTFQAVKRRGKFIRFLLDDIVLISHLRMEGRYGLYNADETIEKHTHVIFHFDDGTELRYKDVRQFGTMHLFEQGEEFLQPPLNKLGLEPLDPEFSFEAFRRTLAARTTKIKPFLLNQAHIVGIGNIYVDEALYKARIHPETTIDSLKRTQLRELYEAIVSILRDAVDAGGSSIKSYVNGQGEMGMFQQSLKVYGRKSEPCLRCGHEVQRIIVAGRGTHICVKCQPQPTI